jgi:hypothetical protein
MPDIRRFRAGRFFHRPRPAIDVSAGGPGDTLGLPDTCGGVTKAGAEAMRTVGGRFGLALVAVVLAVSGCASTSSPGKAASGSSSASTSPDDRTSLQAAVAEADAQVATATSEGWWSGPVCSPDIELHRENAGQDPLPDDQLRAQCAANLAEFWASKDDYDELQAMDASARAAELERVGTVLGLPAGQEPTVGQAMVVHGCEQGWINDPADCAGIPAG